MRRAEAASSSPTGEAAFFLDLTPYSYVGQILSSLPMTLLMTLSLRFLLILVTERMRRVTCVVARNPAGWAFEASP